MQKCALTQLAEHTPTDRIIITFNFANEALRTNSLSILDTLAGWLAPYGNPHRYDIFEETLLEGRNHLAELGRHMSQTVLVGNDASLQGASLTMSGNDAD